MNISQAGHTLQKNATNDSQQSTSGLTDTEVFLDQLNLAQQGTEWYMETDVKSEKERVNEEQQAKRRQIEDQEDAQIVGTTNQAYYEQLKKSDAQESARVAANSENQARTLKHVEKKHLHTPAVTEDGENGKAENTFTKIMGNEMDGAKKGNLVKESLTIAANLETDATKAAGRNTLVKPGEATNGDMMQKFDASMIRGMNTPASGKPGAQLLDKGVPEFSKLAAKESAIGKSNGKNTSAKITSFSNLTTETSLSNRRAEIGMKAESNAGKSTDSVNIKDVIGNVRIMISSKTNEMVMKLAPEHLGKLEIKLKKEGDKLMGRFKVDSLQAKEAIESQLPQLKEGLAEQGIHVEEFAVIINGEEGSNRSFTSNQGHEGDTGESRNADTTKEESHSSTQTAENTVGISQNSASGLNIYA